LFKTFYTGLGGWADRQLPDGTVVWTAPSGQVHTTKPGGALFFPALAVPTGELVISENSGPSETNRGLMMPTRQRTRSEDRAYRIALERQHNAERIALDDEPPPFEASRIALCCSRFHHPEIPAHTALPG